MSKNMVVILTIPAGFSETKETVTIHGARNAKAAITAALKQFPPDKRNHIKAEIQ